MRMDTEIEEAGKPGCWKAKDKRINEKGSRGISDTGQ